MDNNELRHYGILGMKWGVRRSQAQLARIGKKAKKQDWSEDAKTAAEIRTKKVKQMSNAELKKLNERTRLEKEYKNLNKKDKAAGQKFVSDVLKESSKDLAKDYTKKGMKKGIEFATALLKAAK